MISKRETEYRRRNFAGARLARRLAVLLLLLTGGALASSPPRLIHHALGNTTIAGTPQRVVTLFQGATDTAPSRWGFSLSAWWIPGRKNQPTNIFVRR